MLCRMCRDKEGANPARDGAVGGMMGFLRNVIFVAFAIFAVPFAALSQELAQDKAWLQLEALPSAETAAARAAAYAAEFPNVTGFEAGAGWYVVVLGPFVPEEAAGVLADMRRDGRVPRDAYVTDGQTFGAAFWPEAAAGAVAVAAPEAVAVAENVVAEPVAVAVPDETLKQARASEAALTKDDRKALQQALKWYGFYDNAIDGAFGPGTRKSMSAWQEANEFEPTGVLTTLQRATLTANHAADLAEFGFETVTEAESGIEITLPLSLVAFDHYEPPFVHFNEKDGSGLRIMLISEPGGAEALAGLYEILQTLEVVPESGPRALKERAFSIEGASGAVQSLAYAETKDGMVKGYLVVWNPADAERMTRILPVLQSSFRAAGDKALDPGLVPLDDAARAGMMAGLELRKPKLVATGFYVDAKGHVATALSTVAQCGKVTIDQDIEAEVLVQDATSGVAILAPKVPLAPVVFAGFGTASPKLGSDIAVAGYSYGASLPAPVLTFGSFDAGSGLTGEAGVMRLSAPVMAGDVGGPVLNGAGAVVGLLLPQPMAGKVLPQGVALAADAVTLSAMMQGAGLVAGSSDAQGPATPDALNAAALGMAVLVSCWEK